MNYRQKKKQINNLIKHLNGLLEKHSKIKEPEGELLEVSNALKSCIKFTKELAEVEKSMLIERRNKNRRKEN